MCREGLSTVLERAPGLEELSIAHNRLGFTRQGQPSSHSGDLYCFRDTIRYHPSLAVLNMKGNALSPDTVALLAPALDGNTALRCWNLADNTVGLRGGELKALEGSARAMLINLHNLLT